MKKITLILLTIFAVIIAMPAQEKGIIEEVLHNSVEQEIRCKSLLTLMMKRRCN